ncbi:MAG: hypothetical protein ACRDOD_16050 [Streptosporangiaceae bacterium]
MSAGGGRGPRETTEVLTLTVVCPSGPADESTFRRAFGLVSPDVLDRVRGAKNKQGKAPHLAAALAHGIGAVLGQVAVDAKSNEIPAVRRLLLSRLLDVRSEPA